MHILTYAICIYSCAFIIIASLHCNHTTTSHYHTITTATAAARNLVGLKKSPNEAYDLAEQQQQEEQSSVQLLSPNFTGSVSGSVSGSVLGSVDAPSSATAPSTPVRGGAAAADAALPGNCHFCNCCF
jgi:hypothetical protein